MSYALDDLAAAALWPLRNERKEHIGLLYGDGERTPAVSQGEASRAGGTFQIPSGSLRGLFHNHPARQAGRAVGKDEPHEFSAKDVLQAKKLGVPSYISAGDRVLRYDPRTGKVEEVLGQIPIEEIRKLYTDALSK